MAEAKASQGAPGNVSEDGKPFASACREPGAGVFGAAGYKACLVRARQRGVQLLPRFVLYSSRQAALPFEVGDGAHVRPAEWAVICIGQRPNGLFKLLLCVPEMQGSGDVAAIKEASQRL